MRRSTSWLAVLPMLAGLSACGESAATRLAAGDKLVAEGKHAQAAVEYRAAVQADRQNGQASQKLARAYAAAGNLGPALQEFVRVGDLLPNDTTAQLEATRALLELGRFEDARTRAEGILAREPRNVQAHLLRATAAAQMKDADAALTNLAEAVKLDPTRPVSFLNLAALQAQRGENAEAEAAFKQALAVDPKFVQAYTSFANYYWGVGRRADAEQILRQATKENPDSAEASMSLAKMLILMRRPGEAEEPLKRAAETSKEPEARLLLADYYVARGRTDAARPLLEDLLKSPESMAAAGARLAAIERTNGNTAAAYERLHGLLAKDQNNAQLRSLESTWLLTDGRVSEAQASAETATKTNPQAPEGWLALGSVYLERQDASAATKAFQEANKLRPRDTRALISLAGLSIQAGRAGDAVNLANSAVQADRNSGAARYILARALFADGKVNEAEAALKPVMGIGAESPAVLVLAGQIQERRGDHAEARKTFARALELAPASVDALSAAIRIELSARNTAGALRYIDSGLKQSPNDANMLLLAGRTYLSAKDSGRAEASLKKAIEANPSLMEPYTLLGGMYVAQNRLNEARRMFETQIGRKPDDVGAHTMLGMLHATQGKTDLARASFEKVLDIDPRAPVASNNLAYFDAEAGANLDVALNRAQTAKAAAPDDPDFNDTLGWVYVRRGLPALAVTPLEQAIQKDPENPVYHYHLGVAHAKAGDRDRARVSLQKALELSRSIPGSFPGADDAKRTLDGLGR